ncbi:putative ABC transport system permease protein [Bacilli bacterium PM5-3]|nr:putative ABC transport system permease protein [Bacilli bacterium PM5-3]
MILELKKITKEFSIDKKSSFKALNDISLGFNKGEFVSILGPSGCGKSTLLNVIAGLDMPTSGELIIDGKSTKKYKEKDWDFYRKNNIGFVFQQFNLIEHLSALENVEIVMSLTGINKKIRRTRAIELLNKVGINEKHANHLPSELSGGQKQRVAIARALANDPDIILADEPTGALDTKTGIIIMNLLKEVAKDKLIIMVTHNQKLAYEYSSRVVRILDGEITLDECIKNEASTDEISTLSKKNKSMPFKEAFKLSLRNMKKKMGRVVITALAGSIGIAGISLVLGLSNGANIFIDDQIIKFGSSNVMQVSKTEKNKDGEIKEVTNKKKFDFIKENEEVTNIRPQLQKLGSWQVKKEVLETEAYALAPTTNQEFLNDFLVGKLPKENKNELLINKALARELMGIYNYDKDTTKYEKILNKKITLDLKSSGYIGTQTFKVVGIIDEIDVNQGFLYYNYNDLKDFYQKTKMFDKSIYDLTMKKVTNYEVSIKNPRELNNVKDWIYDQSGTKAQGSMMSGMMGATSEGISVVSFAIIFQSALNTLINIAQLVMIAFLVISLIVSSILIAIVLFSSILERRTEIGILKAVGARKKDIMRVFQSEAILLGLFSGVIGVAISFVLIPIAENIVNRFSEYNVSGIIKIPLSGELFGMNIPFLPLLILIFISTTVAFVAGYLPSRKATKMQVIDALRDE